MTQDYLSYRSWNNSCCKNSVRTTLCCPFSFCDNPQKRGLCSYYKSMDIHFIYYMCFQLLSSKKKKISTVPSPLIQCP